MAKLKFFVSSVSTVALLSAITSSAIAGIPTPIGTMTYRIGATGIPTLSGTMLIVLSLLLFAVAFRVARQKGAGKMFATLIGITALSMGGGGIKLVSDAEALMGVSLPLPLNLGPTTGEVDIFEGYNIFRNENTNTVSIQTLTAPDHQCLDPFPIDARPATAAAPPPIQVCGPGVQLPNLAECHVNCIPNASDMRLKQDINYLGKLNNGLRLYSFKYLPTYSSSAETYVGVMAQDLLKDPRYMNAVVTMKNNYYAVDYRSLGLKMITIDQWRQSPENIRLKSNTVNLVSHNKL